MMWVCDVVCGRFCDRNGVTVNAMKSVIHCVIHSWFSLFAAEIWFLARRKNEAWHSRLVTASISCAFDQLQVPCVARISVPCARIPNIISKGDIYCARAEWIPPRFCSIWLLWLNAGVFRMRERGRGVQEVSLGDEVPSGGRSPQKLKFLC